MIEAHHLNALRKICARLENKDIHWAVTGSLNMLLQGLSIKAHDIDLQTDQAGAYQIEAILPEYVVEPVRYLASEWMRSHLGKLVIDGSIVEIIGDFQKLLPDQTWEAPVDVEECKCFIDVNGMRVPGMSLTHEHQAYVIMGRLEKAEMIKKWLEKAKKE
jgi:Aminoglycoside-2''-adenylyltransferase